MIHQAPLEASAAWAYSSVVEHCVDIAGVASSILATPTIFSFAMSFSEIGISKKGATMGALSFFLLCTSSLLELEVRVHEPLTAGVIITRIKRGVADCCVISSDFWRILIEQIADAKGHLKFIRDV